MPSTVEIMNTKAPLFAMRRSFAAMALAVAAALPAQAGEPEAETGTTNVNELVMVEQAGCEWCKRWNEEIGPIYGKTREGAFAPLRRVDLRALPDDLKVTRRVNFTPTFLIVYDGHEMARLEGYPGEDFFWPVIAQLLSQHLAFVPDGADQPES